ncbi:uncharacterized protein LOC111400746 [Olea europaea var. sylvestris]|uniref:uncharacterized protein LOC111400746 n=1 Tax=Olea europaea var. sylvestris TaxID=158386 RepID=UPI000C1D5575|nr:uncharacterized protein LOC111400746 [Olea europaea var. sylvestris]
MRVAVNYDGLIGTPEQLKYDKMCQRFATLADMTVDDDVEFDVIIDWINSQCQKMMMLRSSSNSNVLRNTQTPSKCGASQRIASGSIRDPESAKRKGAPKKIRKKSPLESSLNKVKGTLSSAKGKKPKVSTSNKRNVTPIILPPGELHTPLPFSYTSLLMGDQRMAARLATTMCNSLKERPVWIFQGKEPPQFFAIFQPMVILKEGAL